MEERTDSTRSSDKDAFRSIFGNLESVKKFYKELFKDKQDKSSNGDPIHRNFLCDMTNASHVLLFTAKLDHEKTSGTLKYVFKVKFV